jgi:hypothetical protein
MRFCATGKGLCLALRGDGLHGGSDGGHGTMQAQERRFVGKQPKALYDA